MKMDQLCGYENEKETLRYIVDMLKNTETYKICGAKVPAAVLFTGDVCGKRALPYYLAEDIERPRITVTDMEMCSDKLVQSLHDAIETAPSVLILEDIHNLDESGFTSLQDVLTISRECDVFVIASANSTSDIPSSFAGKFDYAFSLKAPVADVWLEIVENYIQDFPMRIADDVSAKDIAVALEGRGYLALKEIMSISAGKAVYAHANELQREHIAKALLETVYSVDSSETVPNVENRTLAAIHEASHCAMCELFYPGYLSFVSIPMTGSFFSGVTDHRIFPSNADSDLTAGTIVTLAGMAGEEVFLGKYNGVGVRTDLQMAYAYVDFLITEACGEGFSGLIDKSKGASEQRKARIELLKDAKMEELYLQTKELLQANSMLVHALADELMQREFLFSSDIARIKEQTANQMRS